MSEWHPSVVKIEKIQKHPNADNLSIATVLGDYPVIIKTGQYNIDQHVGYLPLDTVVPDVNEYHFLSPKQYEKFEENGEIKQRIIGPKYTVGSVPEKYRTIKAKRILNIYSMGMIVDCPQGLNLGDSLVDTLSLSKKIEEEEDNIPNAKKTRGANAEKAPIGWQIPYYDIEGLRKYIACLNEDEEIVLTEKIHGSNAAFCHDGEKLWVKSRNFYKKMDEDDPWWDIAIRYDLANKLALHPMKVFFGEMYGQVKGFRYDCILIGGAMHSKIRFFDVLEAKSSLFFGYDEFKNITKELDLDTVPELYRGKWLGKEEMYPYAEGTTVLGGKHVREGFVLRTVQERFEPKLNSRMVIKLVGEGYNLAK
jgi:RNA ligase (TIGR02306 family)